ncbi:PREDICTED: uncharacterized protein LOC109589440 [Amphimedon queenslandica]|uniref:Death domain-containing protein n=1 Tax=Amphimedon queenslandica TaxID=400682 RepID=A0AAN0JW06_AMPQE|nr:PREDICTED: uncharacterized protein LOC109589440 [Amphimedon queenslandica]|eukprot:XP_019861085.1 PREDICTED: uncharacterized protein LOC109589440 [Amphimedon queenslandica]
MAASVNYSKENPQDPVKRELTTSDHGTIMGLIDKDIAPKYKELAVQFCIPQGIVDTIAYNNRNNSAWHGLNDVVADWLRGNTEVYDEGVKANVRWLYDAVRQIKRKDLGTKIAKEFGMPEPSDSSTQKGSIENKR